MNTKLYVIMLVCAASLSVSACGMKRALTLPKKEKQVSQKVMYQQLASHQSIDVLKAN